MEIWKRIDSHPDYEVSSQGEVRLVHMSLGYPVDTLTKLLRLRAVQLGKHNWFVLKILVAQAFVENPRNLSLVRHIDGDFTNCTASNLEWYENAESVEELDARHRSEKLQLKDAADMQKFDDKYTRKWI